MALCSMTFHCILILDKEWFDFIKPKETIGELKTGETSCEERAFYKSTQKTTETWSFVSKEMEPISFVYVARSGFLSDQGR